MFQPDEIQVVTIQNIPRTKTVVHQFLFPLFIARAGSSLPPASPCWPWLLPARAGECIEVGTRCGGGISCAKNGSRRRPGSVGGGE